MSYLLGHEAQEWDRLATQHALWRHTLLDVLPLGATDRVLEVGCGNGMLLADLAERCGDVTGLERDPAAAEAAQKRAGVKVIPGDLFHTPLPQGLDWVVARWVFSFLPNPGLAVERLASCLRPGGRLVVQDYNHEGLSTFPDSPEFKNIIQAFRSTYRESGGDLWVAGRMPELFHHAGLHGIEITPHCKAGGPDSAVWMWVECFLLGHLDTLVAQAAISGPEAEAFRSTWQHHRTKPGAVLFSPYQVTVVGTR